MFKIVEMQKFVNAFIFGFVDVAINAFGMFNDAFYGIQFTAYMQDYG